MIDFFGVSITCCLLRLLFRLEEDIEGLDIAIAPGDFDFRPAVTKGCRSAASGFILLSGSQTRHFDIKSTNSSSLHFKTCCNDLLPGRRLRPLELTTVRGVPFASALHGEPVDNYLWILDTPKNNFLRELLLTNSFSGTPRTSMMQDSCSCSFSPGKMGNPVYNSARMQPKLHISIPI